MKLSKRDNLVTLNQRREAILKRLGKVGPFLKASPRWTSVRCGYPRCECARNPRKQHEKFHLSWSDKGRTHSQYVPIPLREEVMAWIDNYKALKIWVREMSILSRKVIRNYVKQKGKAPYRKRKQ